MMSRRKKFWFACLALMLTTVGLELAARVLFWVREWRSPADASEAVVDREHPLRYELAPGKTLPAAGATAHINHVGLRGKDADMPKRRLRVLCLGDSVTFGYAPDVTDQATYPALAGAALEKEQPGQFEVLNAGMPSFCSLDCLGYLVWKALELEPDYVVIMVGWNDPPHCQPLDSPPESRLKKAIEASAFLRLIQLLYQRVMPAASFDPGRARQALAALPRPTDHLSDAVFERYERTLVEMVRICRRRGVEPILVTLPNFARSDWRDVASLTDEELSKMMGHLSGGHLSPAGWYRFISRTNALVGSAASGEQVLLVDGAAVRELPLFFDLCHLNAAGNAALAKLVAAAVVQAERKAVRTGLRVGEPNRVIP